MFSLYTYDYGKENHVICLLCNHDVLFVKNLLYYAVLNARKYITVLPLVSIITGMFTNETVAF